MSLPTPNFVTTEDYPIVCFGKSGSMVTWDTKNLPGGTFVRPIEVNYLPQHILESEAYRLYDKDREIWVYCSIGIIPIPSKILRSV